MTNATNPAAGWYQDPQRARPYRWWTGLAWSCWTSDGRGVWPDGQGVDCGRPAPPAANAPRPSSAFGAAPPKKAGGGRAALIIAVFVGALVAISLLAAEPKKAATAPETKTAATDSDNELEGIEAFRICTKFVKQHLLAPTTATFRNPHEDDGEVLMQHQGGHSWIISSTVDSENGFGAKIRGTFACDLTLEGDMWKLAELQIDGETVRGG